MNPLNLPDWAKEIYELSLDPGSDILASSVLEVLKALSEAREVLQQLQGYHGAHPKFWGDNRNHPGRLIHKALNYNPENSHE